MARWPRPLANASIARTLTGRAAGTARMDKRVAARRAWRQDVGRGQGGLCGGATFRRRMRWLTTAPVKRLVTSLGSSRSWWWWSDRRCSARWWRLVVAVSRWRRFPSGRNFGRPRRQGRPTARTPSYWRCAERNGPARPPADAGPGVQELGRREQCSGWWREQRLARAAARRRTRHHIAYLEGVAARQNRKTARPAWRRSVVRSVPVRRHSARGLAKRTGTLTDRSAGGSGAGPTAVAAWTRHRRRRRGAQALHGRVAARPIGLASMTAGRARQPKNWRWQRGASSS